MVGTRLTVSLHAGLLLAALFLAACQTAPVQEMSDARQAIRVAREAGAEEFAAGEYGQAVGYLQSAEQHLGRHAYDQARRDAIQAKEQALNALQRTEATRPETP